ncbi:NAD(P)/FAD-dependent oxidoreductase [Nakamurella multipartita]|uniref:Monooxygenase FAD-binding n=1 Tax=Nakamurella multipartita (strain ATCC 700099 / DSM 44233 / CIP 104796 / JCM 9543 / NBRC 105858 / Y-104) TaxID=479431 RepID=C8XB95_NAKMY|nr:NAD(P)/FAD-dependent oxidoreductase [Nakamurella multipartita]ACV81387.1 monooxygenase FAD-binding [Nakamurella multipartita DSM 44233]
MRDLVVAGGGPVGLATALYAARAGLDVLVREPRTGPIDKACGEGLMPGAVAALTDLGVVPAGRPIVGIRYLDGSRRVQADFRHGPGRGVSRPVLHQALLTAVAAAGVDVVGPRVERVEPRSERLLVDGEATRYLIAADGLHSPVRRLVGLDRPAAREDRSRRFGLRRHVRMAPWTDYVEVHWSPGGEAYVTPLADDRIGIALLTSRRAPFDELLAEFPALARRLAGGDPERVRGAGPLRQRVRGRVRGRVLLVGDAAGYVDALTGEGLALGLAQARAAVAAVARDQPAAYEWAARRVGWRHTALTLGLLTATRVPAVRGHLVPVARRVPWVFGAAVNQLARPA